MQQYTGVRRCCSNSKTFYREILRKEYRLNEEDEENPEEKSDRQPVSIIIVTTRGGDEGHCLSFRLVVEEILLFAQFFLSFCLLLA